MADLADAIRRAENDLRAARTYLTTLEADTEAAVKAGRQSQVTRLERMSGQQRTNIGQLEAKLARLEAARDA